MNRIPPLYNLDISEQLQVLCSDFGHCIHLSRVLMQIRHGRCDTPQVFEVERQQDVRSPVYYRLERVKDSDQLSGYIHLKEFNALAKRDILIGMLHFMFL